MCKYIHNLNVNKLLQFSHFTFSSLVSDLLVLLEKLKCSSISIEVSKERLGICSCLNGRNNKTFIYTDETILKV